MTDRIAANATQAAVQTAVNAAVDGDRVLIPDGSATWTSGISTTKQIIIRAQNYTPTPAGCTGSPNYTPRSGASSRNVTITNNSASALFNFTTGSSYHCGVGGIRFNDSGNDGAVISATGSGSKPLLIFDNYIAYDNRNWPQEHFLELQNLVGGVMWNCVMAGTLLSPPGDGAFLIKSSRGWTTDSTMGSADTSGIVNFYCEDCTFTNAGICPDIDDNGRYVARYCDYNGSWAETHGFTSLTGGRHWEFYHNRFRQTTAQRNLAGRYFWARAGTGVFTENRVDQQVDPGYYGTNILLDIGDNTTPTSNPQNRQPGWGWSTASGNMHDPMYIWSQTGAQAYTWSVESAWTANIVEGSEIIVNAGAKPGYAQYTYPHPLRSVVEGGASPPTGTITLSVR